MRLGVLFSGGKDSMLAMHLAMEQGEHEIVCLISVVSKNSESYMFHTPNIGLVGLQAQALGLPLISVDTEGQKEEELKDLEQAIWQAKTQYGVEGITTGAVESVYQTVRVRKICSRLKLKCFNPLWKHDQKTLLEELLKRRFTVIISGVFAYPLDASWLGKTLDQDAIERLLELSEKYGISAAGEGGEIETTVLDGPLFHQKIKIDSAETLWERTSGVYMIKKAHLTYKK